MAEGRSLRINVQRRHVLTSCLEPVPGAGTVSSLHLSAHSKSLMIRVALANENRRTLFVQQQKLMSDTKRLQRITLRKLSLEQYG